MDLAAMISDRDALAAELEALRAQLTDEVHVHVTMLSLR